MVYWGLQGVWVFVTALPVFLINGVARQSPLFWGDYAAAAVWALGFVIEAWPAHTLHRPTHTVRFLSSSQVPLCTCNNALKLSRSR